MTKRGNHEGSVYQRESDKKWIAAVGLADGRRKTRTCTTRVEARRALGELRRARDRGELVISGKGTVGAHFDRWLESRSGMVRPTSLAAYRAALAHLRPLIGGRTLGGLRTADIQEAIAVLQKRTPPLSAAFVRQIHAVLTSALDRAVGWEELARNPCTGVELPRAEQPEMRVYDAAQLARAFAAAADDRQAALWRVLGTTGLRKGEVLALRWSDYDAVRGTLTVCRQARRQPDGVVIEDAPLKTRASYRTVVVPTGTRTALARWETTQKAERLYAGPVWHAGPLMFTRPDGRVIPPSSLTDWWTLTCRRAGLPHIRIHDLRHTAATLALAQNVHPKIVQAMLGHSSITITLDHYSHVIPEMQALAADAIERALSGVG